MYICRFERGPSNNVGDSKEAAGNSSKEPFNLTEWPGEERNLVHVITRVGKTAVVRQCPNLENRDNLTAQ